MHNVGKIHKEKVQMYFQKWFNEKTQELADKTKSALKKRKAKRAINIHSHFALVSLPSSFNLPPPTSKLKSFIF